MPIPLGGMGEYASRDSTISSAYSSSNSTSSASGVQAIKQTPAERAQAAITTVVRDVDTIANAIGRVKKAADANDPTQWHVEKASLDHDVAVARKHLDAARTSANDADSAAKSELARAESTFSAHVAEVAAFAEAPRGWTPVSREQEILAILAAPIEGAAKAGYAE